MRLIDADALIERMYHDAFETDTDMQKWDSGCWIRYKMFENAMDSAPTIDAVSEWIPVTERLPNKQNDYLVTIPLDNNSTYVDVLHFHKGKFYEIDSEWGDVECDDVTAWMPLPKPYGEREGE